MLLLFSGCDLKLENKKPKKLKPEMNVLSSDLGYLSDLKIIKKFNSEGAISLNNFAFNLYDQLFQKDKNVFISPVSVYLALSMTYNGAAEKTALEMGNVLETGNLSLEEFNELNRDLQFLILGYKNSKIELANSIWIRDSYQEAVKEDFLKRNKMYYGAMVSSLDFNNQRAVETINNWVKKNTNNRIKEAITGEIDPLTEMFLINTIYFKSDWLNLFKKGNTSKKDFNTPHGLKKVQMMSKNDKIGYVENDQLKAVLLPYKDQKTSMFIILPENKLEDLLLDSNIISDLIKEMKDNQVEVDLSMPRMKIDYEISLKESLMKMGMIEAWSSQADFSKMSSLALEKGLHIDDIEHKTFLEVNEKGTEAAGMTSVLMEDTAFMDKSYKMYIDRPFVLGIIDHESEVVLFLGNIVDP